MSSFGAQMRKRLNELRKAGQDVPRIINEVAEGATIAAVEVATKNTPASSTHIAGTQMRSGQMQQSWEVASKTTPVNGRTVLANNMQYASYVNDGHRMDKHFVPGLIFESGLVQSKPSGAPGGITVGTRTTYVPGLYMKEKAIGKYKTVARTELEKRVREAFQ
jgi:hypothetical protein